MAVAKLNTVSGLGYAGPEPVSWSRYRLINLSAYKANSRRLLGYLYYLTHQLNASRWCVSVLFD